ncbi:MAG TPA: SurA N-terminal domain-containing protein [Pyrinomonadaceae bacterium]|nr:SurA N-terminal domain-containing protein [Pyrinomonadaceae bacterium]
MRKIQIVFAVTGLVVAGLLAGCSSNNTQANENMVAATVNGRNIMLQEVERAVSQQAGGNPAALSQLELAQARLTVLDGLIKREVLFQRAEREKVLPTEAQIDGAIAQQKEQSGMTQEDFEKGLKAQNMSIETLREEARKDLAITALQDKYNGKITISDRELEDFYKNNPQQFVSRRGVALAMIVVDPADNSSTGIKDDAKNEADAKLKIDNIYQQLQGKADFATVARARSEDFNSLRAGGDIGFATEEQLRENNFPPELISNLMGSMQVGDYTQPTFFRGKWYIFKLAEKRLQNENFTLDSPGVRQQITQALTNQRKQVLNAALLEVAINDARIVNNLAANMLNNPGNLGLRPAGEANPAQQQQPAQAPTTTPAASAPASSPAATTPGAGSSPVSVRPANGNANANR